MKEHIDDVEPARDRIAEIKAECDKKIASAVKAERQNIEEEKRETGYELLNYIENLYPHLHLYDDKNWISLKKEWLKKSR